jgi:hypothetical protein
MCWPAIISVFALTSNSPSPENDWSARVSLLGACSLCQNSTWSSWEESSIKCWCSGAARSELSYTGHLNERFCNDCTGVLVPASEVNYVSEPEWLTGPVDGTRGGNPLASPEPLLRSEGEGPQPERRFISEYLTRKADIEVWCDHSDIPIERFGRKELEAHYKIHVASLKAGESNYLGFVHLVHGHLGPTRFPHSFMLYDVAVMGDEDQLLVAFGQRDEVFLSAWRLSEATMESPYGSKRQVRVRAPFLISVKDGLLSTVAFNVLSPSSAEALLVTENGWTNMVKWDSETGWLVGGWPEKQPVPGQENRVLPKRKN